MYPTRLWSCRRRDDGQCSFEVVGDDGEADLRGGLGQSLPAHAPQSVAALPSSKDLLDPAAHPMDRPAPGIEALECFGLVCAPHGSGDNTRRAASCPHGTAEVGTAIGTCQQRP